MSLGTRCWSDSNVVLDLFVLSRAIYTSLGTRRWIAELFAFFGLLLLVLPPHSRSVGVAGVCLGERSPFFGMLVLRPL